MDASRRPPLRGRERELAVIRRKLSQVRAGTGCVVVVEGSAGLGKTRLLDECVSMAGELSFRVGRGAGEPGRVASRPSGPSLTTSAPASFSWPVVLCSTG